MKICYWLTEVAFEACERWPQDVLVSHMAAMLYGYSKIFDVCCNGQIWLSVAEANELKIARKMSLRNNAVLTSLCPPHFPQKPKLHLCDHALRSAETSFLNPTAHWAFADEDFIGKIKVLRARCHTKTP